jgi:tetratricopeptide (TPR) repeat protein
MIKKITLLIIYTYILATHCHAQETGEFYYKQGLEKAQTGELEKAIELFDKSIELKGDEYLAWYNRGIVKIMLGRYEDAYMDLEKTIQLNASYKKAYLNRGMVKRHLTDFEGAISDYNVAIALDTAYAEAYYDRGQVYELLGRIETACPDFNKALQLGFKNAEYKMNTCKNPESIISLHPVLWLTSQAANNKYGFGSDQPVKVGTGPDGGPANERAYLDLLRDAKGRNIRYQRISSCCAYPSSNAPKGLAMVDKYQLSFLDEHDEQKEVFVYLSFYDYDNPKVLFGFKTVKHKQ